MDSLSLSLTDDYMCFSFYPDCAGPLANIYIDKLSSRGFHYEGRLAKLCNIEKNNIGNFPFDTYSWNFFCSFRGRASEACTDIMDFYDIEEELLKSEPLITIETDIPEWEFNIVPESPRYNGSGGLDLAFYIKITRITMFKVFPLIIYISIALFALLSLILAILVAIKKLISNISSILFSISTVLFSLITIRNQLPIMIQKTSVWDIVSIYISTPIIIISILFVLGYIIWDRQNNKQKPT